MIKLNNKGFTLTEVLAVIIVLIAILTISLPDLSSTVETVKKEDVSSGITSYAELYLSDNLDAIKKHMGGETSCYIETSDLYDYGYKVKERDNQYVVYNFSNLEFNSVNSVEGISKCDISIEDLDNIGSGEELGIYSQTDSFRKRLCDNVKLGDFVVMKPTGSAFSKPNDWGGVSFPNALNPSELDLWNVLYKDNDCNIELVSTYVSKGTIHFQNAISYQYFVYYLNKIAYQYRNLKYTVEDENGYYTVGGRCSVPIIENDITVYSFSSPGIESLDKNLGGSDNCYESDLNRVTNYAGLNAFVVGSTTKSGYWLASRNSFVKGTSLYWNGRYLGSDGNVSSKVIYCTSSGVEVSTNQDHIRPIITLKNDVAYINEDANGTSEKPYILG